MSNISSEFCAKCTTGTMKNLPQGELQCEKCGIILKRTGEPANKMAHRDRMEYGPRAGGNRCAG